MTVLLVLLSIYLGSLLFVRLRNRAHLPWSRQLANYSVFMVPFNIPAYLLSKVSTKARLPISEFPQLQLLQDNWQTIRDEALALYEQGRITPKNELPASSFYRDGRWTSFYLKAYDIDIPSARALAPRTLALIDQVPGMNLALFAVLNSGKSLARHHDPFALSVRYSLGLATPNDDKCGLVVNGEHYTWRDGECRQQHLRRRKSFECLRRQLQAVHEKAQEAAPHRLHDRQVGASSGPGGPDRALGALNG